MNAQVLNSGSADWSGIGLGILSVAGPKPVLKNLLFY